MLFDLAGIAVATAAAFALEQAGIDTKIWLPPFVAALAIVFTRRSAHEQALLARQKLLLDLIPRRAKWYDELKLALEQRHTEREAEVQAILASQPIQRSPTLNDLIRLETESGWLFSREMTALMARLINADERLVRAEAESRTSQVQPSLAAAEILELSSVQTAIQDFLVEYIFVGDIGKPKNMPVTWAKPGNIYFRW